MFTASYTPCYGHGPGFSDSYLLSPQNSSVDRRTKLCAPFLHHFTCHDDVPAWFCLPRVCMDARKRQQNPSGATAHALTTRSAGRAWRAVSRRFFSISCRRVLCFGSIHSAPSHFVSVNSASSGGLPTSPSPLCPPAWKMTVDRII